jgi:hypothetical protein
MLSFIVTALFRENSINTFLRLSIKEMNIKIHMLKEEENNKKLMNENWSRTLNRGNKFDRLKF